MAHPIPGTVDVEGREFIYLEVPKEQSFSGLMQDVLSSCPTTPVPSSGGALEEKTRLTLPDQTSFLAVSYKGDLTGWRNKFVDYCEGKGRKWAVINQQILLSSDGIKIPLVDCEVEFGA